MANGNIQEYANQDDGLQVSGAGASAFEQAARINRIDANEAGNAIGGGISALGVPAQQAYDKYVTQPEISKLSASGAMLLTTLSSDFNKAMASDPNDENAGQKFLQTQLEPALEKFQTLAGTPKGQAYAQQFADTLRSHFATQSVAAASNRAGAAVVNNYGTQTNALAAAAAADPTSLDTALDLNAKGAAVLAQNSGADTAVTSDMASGLQTKGAQEIILGGLHGMVMKNPQAAAADLASGKLDKYLSQLPETEQASVKTFIGEGVKADAANQKAQAAAKDKADKEQFNSTAINQFQQAVKTQPDGTTTVDNPFQLVYGQNGLASLPGVQSGAVSPGELHATYSAYQAINAAAAKGATVKNDPSTFQDFLTRASLPADSPLALTKLQLDQAVITGHLSGKSYTDFSHMIADRDPTKTQDAKLFNTFMTTVLKPMIWPTGTVNKTDFSSAAYGQRWVQAMQDFKSVYDAARGSGLSSADLLNPHSKNYILNMFPIKPYQLSTDDLTAANGGQLPTQMSPAAPIPPAQTNIGANPSGPGLDSFFSGSDFGSGAGSQENVQSLTSPPVTYKPGMSMDDLAKSLGGK